MKFHPSRLRRDRGSVMMVTLVVALILGVSLASYLLLVRAQTLSIARSQAWHAALTAAEAGVEEALAQLNATPLATNIAFTTAWKPESGGYRLDEARPLAATAPVVSNYYTVRFKSSQPPKGWVTIYATGYATVPLVSATIARSIEIRATNASLFTMAALARGEIDMNNRRLDTDSFDSTNPYRSTGGRYDRNKTMGPRDWHGDIATTLGIRNYEDVDVHGQLSLGAGATNRDLYHFDVSGNITRDFNTELPEVPRPFAAGTGRIPTSGAANGTNYTYVLRRDREYELNSINGSVYVTNEADAVLFVSGNASISNLVLAPRSSLKLYVAGASASISAFSNPGVTTNFQYFGMKHNTNLALPGSGNFAGTIYAPNARLTASAPGDTTLDFQGAIVVNSFDAFAHLRLHFDESLLKTTENVPKRGFIVTSWREIPVPD
jgi:hypothetical protein